MKYKNITNLEEFKKDYDNLTIIEIVNKYKLDKKTIWSYAKRLNINRKRGSKRINKVNDNYFSLENDCANKYYILGLIYTDGNLPKRNKNSFIISSIDLDLLEDIKKELNFSGRITQECHNKFNKVIYKLQVTSEQIRKDLENLGLKPNKTFDIKFPNISNEYLKDFIRGLWDGDGSVSNPKSKSLTSNFVCASKEFIQSLLNNIPINNKVIKERKRKTILYSINFSSHDSVRIRNFLYYKDCLCLKRKRDRFFNYEPKRSETIIHNPN